MSEKNNVNNKSCVHRQSKRRKSFTTFHGQASIQTSPRKQGSIMWNGYFEGQTPLFQTSSPFSLLTPSFTEVIADQNTIQSGITLWLFEVSCPSLSPPIFLSCSILLIITSRRVVFEASGMAIVRCQSTKCHYLKLRSF